MKAITRQLIFAGLLILGLLSFAAMPAPVDAVAGPQQQTTPGVDDTFVTPVVPETGGEGTNDSFAASWLLWVILGVALLALIIGLAARGSTMPPPPPPQ